MGKIFVNTEKVNVRTKKKWLSDIGTQIPRAQIEVEHRFFF